MRFDHDDQQATIIAQHWGVSVEHLESAFWELEEIEGNDGEVYGYLVRFAADTHLELLEKLGVASSKLTREVSLWAFDEPEPDDGNFSLVVSFSDISTPEDRPNLPNPQRGQGKLLPADERVLTNERGIPLTLMTTTTTPADDKTLSYWTNQPPSSNNLRLFQPDGTWLAWDDREEEGKTRRGAKGQVEERLLSVLNATNLMALLGSGASFAAKNAGGKQAPGMGDLWDDARQKVGEAVFDAVVAEVWGATDKKDIESLLSLCKMTVELQAARGESVSQDAADGERLELPAFVQKAEQAILDRVDFVSEETDLISHKEFLRRLARRSPEKGRVKLFTTNYDRCIEEAAVARNLALIDGFSHSAVQRFNRDHFQQDIVRRSAGSTRADFVDGVFHLYKLHGSMDWRRRKSDGVVIRRLGHDGNHEPVLIYPRSSKYQEAFAPPYLDMFAAWQAALREPDTTLIVTGFGFADDHISAPIWSALESNLSIRLVLCDPCFVPVAQLDDTGLIGEAHIIEQTNGQLRDYQTRILQLVREGDSRITVLNGRFSDLALAVPEIMGETDRQRLEARLEHIRGQGHGDE